MLKTKTRAQQFNIGNLVYPASALLVIRSAATLFLLSIAGTYDVTPSQLADSELGFFLLPADILGVLGIIGAMLGGGWRAQPDRRARRYRIIAALVGIGSLVVAETVLRVVAPRLTS